MDQGPKREMSWDGIPVELDRNGRTAELVDERNTWVIEVSGEGRAELGNERTV